MADINIVFCQTLLTRIHGEIKKHFPNLKVRKAAWVYHYSSSQTWEFHGPDKFFWSGHAHNAYDARFQGWCAWLDSKNISYEKETADD